MDKVMIKYILLFFILFSSSSCARGRILPTVDNLINQTESFSNLIIPDNKTPVPDEGLTILSTVPPITAAATETDHPISNDLFTHRDVPPKDVINQIQFVSPGGAGGAGHACEGQQSKSGNQPDLILNFKSQDNRVLHINETMDICGFHLGKMQPIKLRIITPTQVEKQYTLTPIPSWDNPEDYVLFFQYEATVGDPLGIYKLIAQGENGSAEGTFEVVLSAIPSAGKASPVWGNVFNYAIDKRSVSSIEIPQGGFPANSPVSFTLYNLTKKDDKTLPDIDNCQNIECPLFTFDYLTHWDQQSDSRGELVTRIPISDNTPVGDYVILVNGTNNQACSVHGGPFFRSYGSDWESMKCDYVIYISIAKADPIKTNISQPTTEACKESLPPRLQVGQTARVVTSGLAPQLALRSQPSLNSQKIHVIAAGRKMTILEGPVCADGSNWWLIHSENGFEGWAREGDSEDYWIEPIQ